MSQDSKPRNVMSDWILRCPQKRKATVLELEFDAEKPGPSDLVARQESELRQDDLQLPSN